MKILLKRNQNSATALPSSLSAGEPLWFKDQLWIGSVGTSAGGTESTAGTPVRIASYSDLSSVDHNQTVKVGSTTFGADAAVEIIASSTDPGISVTTGTNQVIVGHAAPGSAGSTTYTKVAIDSKGHVVAASSSSPNTLSGYGITDAKIESGTITLGSATITPLTAWDTSDNHAFKTIAAANDTGTSDVAGNTTSVVAGSNTATLTVKGGNKWIHSTGDDTNKVIKISHAVGTISTDTSEGTVGTGTSTITIPTYTYDAAGHITAVDTKTVTITIPAAVDGAMTYRGTTTSLSGSTLNYDAGTGVTLTPEKGDTLVASAAVNIVPAGASTGTKTTIAGKQIAGNDATVSVGDMFIYNGTNWQLVPSGDATVTNGVSNATQTATTSASNGTPTEATVGTVDGVTLKIKAKHHQPSGASEHTTAVGGVSNNTITVPKVKTDVDGHVTYLDSDSWTYTAPAAPNTGKLQLKVGTAGTAVDSGFNADSASDVSLVLNNTAAGAKFAVDSSTKVISITEIDGGLID